MPRFPLARPDESFDALTDAGRDQIREQPRTGAGVVVEEIAGGKRIELHDREVVDVGGYVRDLSDGLLPFGRIIETHRIRHQRRQDVDIEPDRDAVLAERRVVRR